MNPLDTVAPYPSAKDLERVFITAAPHAHIVYHVGDLEHDRIPPAPLSEEAAEALDAEERKCRDEVIHRVKTLNAVADYAMLLEQEGRADLLRRRLGAGVYEFVLQKRATLGTPCDYERGAEPAYHILNDKEPRREPPREGAKPKKASRPILLRHLSPRQQHAIEREPYLSGGRR